MEDIIEKRPSNPIATSLLVISAACLVACLILGGMELHELKHGANDASASGRTYAKSKFEGKGNYVGIWKQIDEKTADFAPDGEMDEEPEEDEDG